MGSRDFGSTLPIKRLVAIAIGFTVAMAVGPSSIHAKPPLTNELIRGAVSMEVSGVGCSTATVPLRTRSNRVHSVSPEVGESLGIDAEVLNVRVQRGYVVWTIGPGPEACAWNEEVHGHGRWRWRTYGTNTWEAMYRRQVYSVRASPSDGIDSIAGLSVQPRSWRNQPTVMRAVRAWGRPSGIRQGRGGWSVACRLWWPRIGLQAVFMNLGLGSPCRHGKLDSAVIRGRGADRWAVRIGEDPAIVRGTPLAYLRSSSIGSRGDLGSRTWTLAEVYQPIGISPGFVPSVSAVLTGRGALRGEDRILGFDLWVGAAGD